MRYDDEGRSYYDNVADGLAIAAVFIGWLVLAFIVLACISYVAKV